MYTYCANDGVNCVDPSGHDISKNVPKIDVCVDGPIKYKNKAKKYYGKKRPYGDNNNQSETGFFFSDISPDAVPYVVIPYGGDIHD